MNEEVSKDDTDTDKLIERLNAFAEHRISGQEFYKLSDLQIKAIAHAAERNLESGRYEQARVIYESLVEFVPTKTQYSIALGIVYFLEKNYVQSIARLSRIIENGNREGIVYLMRGESLFLSGDKDAGIEDLREAVKLETDKNSLVHKRAQSLVTVLTRGATQTKAAGPKKKKGLGTKPKK